MRLWELPSRSSPEDDAEVRAEAEHRRSNGWPDGKGRAKGARQLSPARTGASVRRNTVKRTPVLLSDPKRNDEAPSHQDRVKTPNPWRRKEEEAKTGTNTAVPNRGGTPTKGPCWEKAHTINEVEKTQV